MVNMSEEQDQFTFLPAKMFMPAIEDGSFIAQEYRKRVADISRLNETLIEENIGPSKRIDLIDRVRFLFETIHTENMRLHDEIKRLKRFEELWQERENLK